MDFHSLLMFVVAGLLLNLTPGPDVLYILSHALRSGARSGVVAALGITTGCFVHIVSAALGVSALLVASATAFTVLKWAGAAYLMYVGLRLLWSPGTGLPVDGAAWSAPAAPLREVFLRGFWTNALNPKVAVFFLAFVPQFIGADVDNKPLAFLLLGLLFNFNGMWVNIGWALGAAWMSRHSDLVRRSLRGLDRVAGGLFVAFGLKLALSENPVR